MKEIILLLLTRDVLRSEMFSPSRAVILYQRQNISFCLTEAPLPVLKIDFTLYRGNVFSGTNEMFEKTCVICMSSF